MTETSLFFLRDIAAVDAHLDCVGNLDVRSGRRLLTDECVLVVVHDRSYDLAHIVDAYRYVDSGHKRGNVLIHPWPISREVAR